MAGLPDSGTRGAVLAHFERRERMWNHGWQRYAFPGLWLVYCLQTVGGVHKHSHGFAAGVGYALVVAFAVSYLVALPAAWSDQLRRFWTCYLLTYVLTIAEAFFAHADAFVFCVFIAVLTIAGVRRYAVPIVGAMAAIITLAPLTFGWSKNPDVENGLTVVLVAFAMYGFFAIIRSNYELAAARSEVARLAAENERMRIARDLHDLLGHSLTTITVKAALAGRLAAIDPDRAAVEIGEVEQLSRRALTDVRNAVAGYREVSLANELVGAREILRAAGIDADLPATVDVVDERLVELFGWVVREGVTNVVRHSRAHHCTISLGASWVEIVDDGRGGVAEAGSGLTGLRERVATQGGSVDAGGCPAGWRLRVDVPLGGVEPTSPAHEAVAEVQTS